MAYGFLVLSARALPPERFAALSALWALAATVGPGFFFPLEQEVARATASRGAHDVGTSALLRRAALFGGVLAAALVLGSLATHRVLLDRLFGKDVLLLAGFVFVIVGFAGQHLTKGLLAGARRFSGVSAVVVVESAVRLAACAALFAAHVATAGPYGLALGIAPLASVGVGLALARGVFSKGPVTSWGELGGAIGHLLAASVFAQLLVNIGPLAVRLLASEQEAGAAGRFLAVLVVARAPLFLFLAVQAALLPKLSGLASRGRLDEFQMGLRRLVLALVVVGAAGTAGAFVVGPTIVRVLFGPAYALGSRDFATLAGGTIAYMVALAYAQGLIALRGHRLVAAAWLSGLGAFAVVTTLGSELISRVGNGFFAGSVTAAVVMALLVQVRLRSSRAPGTERVEQLPEVPFVP